MNCRISKARSRSPRMRLSKCSQEQLLNAVARDRADYPPHQCATSSGSEPSRRAGETTVIQHPKPKPAHAAFLKRFVEPSQPSPRSGSVDSFVSEWLQSVGSDQITRCRSDSCLSQLVSEPVPRQLAKSAPQTGYTRDADGFSVPPTPVSTGSRPRGDIDGASVAPSDATGFTSSSSRASGRSLVEDPYYRQMNLAANNIYMRPPNEEFPEEIANLVDYVRRDRDSPGPSADQVKQDSNLAALQWKGAGEPQVEQYFRTHIFPYPDMTESLQRNDRQPLARHAVPNAGSKLKVSTPVPDMLYGYNRQCAFPKQQVQLISMGTEMAANTQDLLYPFFVIEFTGEGPSGAGNLWVATNQCLGGAASCVNIAERLNRQLEQCKSDAVHSINSATFSIAMSGTEARLYISWKHDELEYYMTNVESFLLQRPDHYLEFRKYVRNIIDWGRDKRLADIRSSLDTLLEESRKKVSEAAKSRPPPSDSSKTSGKRCKSSSRGRIRGKGSDASQNSDVNEPY